ncbi:PucR family transcriptional regulator [Nocardioides sediminis]|uniref:PucR family transcriptional regulator n=1 Tax=Nocardioides sediminis TaxID=433648 RepID=UPI00131EF4EF|nr:PucR family transcriptional regulator [Nocardioides sediminis]
MTRVDDGVRSAVDPDPVARAWRLVLHRSDEIADVISSRLLAKDLDAYRTISPHLPEDVRHSCREHIRRGLLTLSGVGSDTAPAVELWRETGRRRARQGVPLELVLNAYTMGARVLWEALTETATTHEHVPDADLLGAARGVWANLDVQNAVLIEAYHRERDRVQRRDQQRQQTVLDGLVDGRGGDPTFAANARTALGVAAGDAVACVVVLPGGPGGPGGSDGSGGEGADLVGPVEDRLDRRALVSHWHVRSGAAYGLVSGALPDEALLVELLAPVAAGRVAVAGSAGGIAGFGTAFQLALRAAETLSPGERGVVGVTDRLPEVLLAGDSHVTPLLVAEAFGELLEHPQAETLVTTLRALLAHDGSPTHAAAELYCHRNTVIYRMKQIERLTGRNLTDPRDKMLLWLAVTARAAAGAVRRTR